MSDFQLIDETNIDAVSFDAEPNGELMRQLIAPWIHGGVERYLNNGTGDAKLARVGGRLIPLLINHGVADATSLCSPSAYYVGYARDFVNKKVQSGLLGAFAGILFRLLAVLLENRSFNRVIYINHWFLPTSPPPLYDAQTISILVYELERLYPNHAMILKGLSGPDGASAVKVPPEFRPVFQRQVYYFAGHDKTTARKKSVRGTLGKLRRSRHRILRYSKNCSEDLETERRETGRHSDVFPPGPGPAPIESGAPARLRSLYRALYIDKHSSLNPDYSVRWFSEIATQPALNTRVLERDGRIDAFGCILELDQRCGRAMIASVGGYDTSLESRTASLYELLQGLMLKSAIDAGTQLNLSSGADSFKRLRGARPAREYDGIRVSHLKLAVRWRWRLLTHAYNRVAPAVYRAV